MPADDLNISFPPTADEAEHFAARLGDYASKLWANDPALARLCEKLSGHFRTFAKEERATLPEATILTEAAAIAHMRQNTMLGDRLENLAREAAKDPLPRFDNDGPWVDALTKAVEKARGEG